jgi:precorrin-2 dehydrogenase/sirohydrochlorin ferrochelatase
MTSSYNREYYPVYLDLHGRKAVVIGAGSVGRRKIETLVAYGADVVVIAPEVDTVVQERADEKTITLLKRPYQKGDLDGAFLVVCATDNAQVNREVHQEAERCGTLLNMVDYPPYCNFIVPSIVKRGNLQIAISTGGAAPVVARTLRKELEQQYGDAWGEYVNLLGQVRSLVISRVPGGEEIRKPIFESIASSDLFHCIETGKSCDPEEIFDRFAPDTFACKQGYCDSCTQACQRATARSQDS